MERVVEGESLSLVVSHRYGQVPGDCLSSGGIDSRIRRVDGHEPAA